MLVNKFSEMFGGDIDNDTHIIIDEVNNMVSIGRIFAIAGKVTTIGKWQEKLDKRAEKFHIDTEEFIELEFVQDGVAQFSYSRAFGPYVCYPKSVKSMRD